MVKGKGQFAASGSDREPMLQCLCSAEEHVATQHLSAPSASRRPEESKDSINMRPSGWLKPNSSDRELGRHGLPCFFVQMLSCCPLDGLLQNSEDAVAGLVLEAGFRCGAPQPHACPHVPACLERLAPTQRAAASLSGVVCA